MSQMKKKAERQAISSAQTGLKACEGMDMVIAGIGGLFVGISLAEKFRLPLLQAYYIPFTPTRAFPSFLFPKLPQWLGGYSNRFSFHIMRQIIWQGFVQPTKWCGNKCSTFLKPHFGDHTKWVKFMNVPFFMALVHQSYSTIWLGC